MDDHKASLREALQKELETTRDAYHRLLDTMSDSDWQRRSANPRMTVGQLMSHVAEDVGFMTRMVEWAKKGQNVDPPKWLFYLLNPLGVRWGARNVSRQTVGAIYDQGHTRLCAQLQTVKDEDWGKGATFLGRYTTVEGVFQLPVKHLEQHAADINLGLGRLLDHSEVSEGHSKG
jgi:hypothetical protein